MTASETGEFPALDFYTRYYDALPRSPSYSQFCRQLYGMDLGQHGFCDMAQLDALLDAVQLKPGESALDIGCGDGRMAENISDRTMACLTGLDLIPTAVEHGQRRTEPKAGRLRVRRRATRGRWSNCSRPHASTS